MMITIRIPNQHVTDGGVNVAIGVGIGISPCNQDHVGSITHIGTGGFVIVGGYKSCPAGSTLTSCGVTRISWFVNPLILEIRAGLPHPVSRRMRVHASVMRNVHSTIATVYPLVP